MKQTEAPHIDTRRAEQFRGELLSRARAWIRGWSMEESPGDFGAALLDVAARFSAQVAERLDRAGEKLSRGLIDWLAIRGDAAKPARMPVVFKLADTARDPVLAPKPVRLQASVGTSSVVFETETDVNLVPGTLAQMVAVDAPGDAWYLPPPGISSLDPLDPLPDLWTLKNFANSGATKLQLDPALGLDAGTYIEMGGNQYRVVGAEGDLVTIEPALINTGGLPVGTPVTRVAKFDPFGGSAHNWQEHALYLGDKDVLNLEAAATIEVIGAATLRDATWQFFGKKPGDADADWQDMKPADTQPPGSVLLEKPAGSIEPTKIGDGEPNRWIRARLTTVTGAEPLLGVEELKLVINRGNDELSCPESGGSIESGAQAEGFANATPLAFTSVFYPLGREPKQFDAFYLGCADAFSKKGAKVAICFEMADASADSFGVLGTGKFENDFVASVGQDSALHIYLLDSSTGMLLKYRDLGPLQPPKPPARNITAEGDPVALVRKPKWRPALWEDDSSGSKTIYFATAAGAAIWVWKEDLDDKDGSGWIHFGSIVSTARGGANAQVTGLLYIPSPVPTLFASYDGTLFSHSALDVNFGQPWTKVPLKNFDGTSDIAGKLKSIGPVKREVTAPATGWEVAGIVGVVGDDLHNVAYGIGLDGRSVALDAAAASEVMADAIPIGIEDAAFTRYYFWNQAASAGVIRSVEAVPVANAEPTRTSITSTPLPDGPDKILGNSLDVYFDGADATVVAAGSKADESFIVSWAPFDVSAPVSFTQAKLPAGSGPLGGAATLLGDFVIAPGGAGDAWISSWNPNLLIADSTTLRIGAVTDNPTLLVATDIVMRDLGIGVAPETATVVQYLNTHDSKYLYSLATPSGVPSFATNDPSPPLFVFRRGTPGTGFAGTKVDHDHLKLASGDTTVTGDWLALTTTNGIQFSQVTRNILGPYPNVAALDPDPTLTGAANASVTFWRAVPLTARIAPFFVPSAATSSSLTSAALAGIPFVFENPLLPLTQFSESFSNDGAGHPLLIVLKQNWTIHPNNNNVRDFTFDATVSAWKRQFEQSPINPELAWEFWNGTGWTKLELDNDETLDFTGSGRVKFKVPGVLTPTDVSGKTNYWIRARLIVGDYGREKITVVTVTKPDKSTEQTINRDTSDFHPPLVVAMRIRYALDTSVFPSAVLTQDSGSWRNQSDANKALGAYVEGFVPLALLMQRLSGSSAATDDSADADCGCANCAGSTAAASEATDSASADSGATQTAAATDRSILLGFDAAPLGEPVNVLLLVEERPHDGFAPLTVEALVKDRFEPLTAKDGTRALGESGIVSMVFPVKPGPRDLFGRTLSWVRLRPSRIDPNSDWQPMIRGAYLNAAWASATETLTREPLGSSDGRPFLTVRVARPPLLQDTLELRVREPLDEEERQAMLDADQTTDPDQRSVKYDIPDMSGNWVLWKQVPDPADYGPHERVYALDEALGEIQFGDGMHGMIPPIGRDAVVAFTYQRTEPPADGGDSVPANAVVARTKLNLVTPVESVESAAAADHAAGGAPPESAERVQRFGNARLRHRGRALVLGDFEDLALASSPDIVQARAFKRAGGIRLVVVMRGAKPLPDAAQRRALLRELQAAASPLVGEHGALLIEGARVRRLRLRLLLRVASLDDAGMVANAVKRAITAFFDSGAGGVDGTGWPLGTAPADDDIAFALEDLPGLEGIADISRQEIAADGTTRAWNASVRPDELVFLDDDPLRLEFATLEVEA